MRRSVVAVNDRMQQGYPDRPARRKFSDDNAESRTGTVARSPADVSAYPRRAGLSGVSAMNSARRRPA